MADFSKREDVEHWLGGIRPAQRRRDVAIAFAARAALRVLPLLVSELRATRRVRDNTLSAFVLPCLRATALPWAAAKYPAHGNELRAAASAAASAADAASAASTPPPPPPSPPPSPSPPPPRLPAAFAFAAASAASAAASAAAFAFAAAAASADASATAAAFAAASAADAAMIDSGRSGAQLAGLPLWPGGAPDRASEAWWELKAALISTGEGWEVWSDWYEARLAGDERYPPIEELEIGRVTIADEVWQRGPAAVNGEIKMLIAQYAPDEPDVDRAAESDDQDQAAFAPILATRATLRVLPLMAADGARLGDAAKSKFLLSVFRALAAAWANTPYSSLAGSEWSDAAGNDVNVYRSGSAQVALYVADAAAQSALAAGNLSPANAAAHASRALFQVKAATLAWRRDGVSDVIVERANSSDRDDIVPGIRPDQIAQIELWPGRDPPQFIGEQWETLKEALRHADEGWDVWIDWYEARLDGRVRSQEVELAYVNFIRNVSPTATAWEANSEIRRLIAEATKTSEPTEALWDFFVSYATEDEAIAREVVGVLESAGHSTIAQFKDFSVGANFVHEMNRGLAGAGRVVAIYSPNYQASPHCQAEWAAAYAADPSGAKRKLVPFLLAPTALDPLARQVVYKSLIGLTPAQRNAAVLEAIAPRPPKKNAEAIKSLLAEVASPQASINAKQQLDAGPNAAFDRPFVDEDLPELPSTQRGLANAIRKSLPRNTPPVVGAVLESYSEHLLERGTQPIVRYLDDLAAALRAELDAPEAVDWGKGLAKLFQSSCQ